MIYIPTLRAIDVDGHFAMGAVTADDFDTLRAFDYSKPFTLILKQGRRKLTIKQPFLDMSVTMTRESPRKRKGVKRGRKR